MIAIVNRFVQMKSQLGCVADREPPTQFAANVAARAFQPRQGLLERRWIPTQPVDVHVGILVVWAHPRAGNRHSFQARILDASLYDVAQLALDHVCNSLLTSVGQR